MPDMLSAGWGCRMRNFSRTNQSEKKPVNIRASQSTGTP
jgi:hypothetical protein